MPAPCPAVTQPLPYPPGRPTPRPHKQHIQHVPLTIQQILLAQTKLDLFSWAGPFGHRWFTLDQLSRRILTRPVRSEVCNWACDSISIWGVILLQSVQDWCSSCVITQTRWYIDTVWPYHCATLWHPTPQLSTLSNIHPNLLFFHSWGY